MSVSPQTQRRPSRDPSSISRNQLGEGHDDDRPDKCRPAYLIEEQLSQASPYLLRELLTQFIKTLKPAEADAVCRAAYGTPSRVATMIDRIVHHAAMPAPNGANYRICGGGIDSLFSVCITADNTDT